MEKKYSAWVEPIMVDLAKLSPTKGLNVKSFYCSRVITIHPLVFLSWLSANVSLQEVRLLENETIFLSFFL